MVADECRVVRVQETEGTVVDRKTENRHVVGIHDSMREAGGLPLRDEPRRASDDFAEQTEVFFAAAFTQVRIVAVDGVIRQRPHEIAAVAVMEHLERPESDMRGRKTRKNGGRFRLLAINGLVAAYDAKRTRRRNPQRVHRFAAQKFTDGRTQHGPSVGPARESRQPGAFQLPLVPGNLAQKDRAAVTEPPRPRSELMTGVNGGYRCSVRRQRVTGGDRKKLRIFRRKRRVEADQL